MADTSAQVTPFEASGGTRLIERLAAIVGARHVVTGETDLSAQTANVLHGVKGLPLCLVYPADVGEVSAVVRACADAGMPMVPMGGNTGLAGGTRPWPAGQCVMIGLKRMNRILDVSSEGGTMTVQAGCILADVQAEALRHDRLFPLSLGAEGSCQIGGNIATNAGGVNALRYGVMRDLVFGLQIVLPDGSVLDLNRSLRKDNAGYDLKHLFIGSGGTLGIITAAVLRLFPKPRAHMTAMTALRDADAAIEMLGRLSSRFGESLTSLELIDALTIQLVGRHLPSIAMPYATEGDWHLLIELSGRDETELAAGLEELLGGAFEDGVIADASIATSIAQSRNIWALRHATAEVAKHLGPRFANDASVPVGAQPAFLAEVRRRVAAWPEAMLTVYGHVGDGNLHLLVGFPGRSADDPAIPELRRAVEAAVTATIVAFNGSVTAEHGIGFNYLQKLIDSRNAAEIAVMQQLRRSIDPRNLMNPGKVVPT
ncbi:FAD-binding oxidoreductase [Chelatococcus asaccharovorans]|uniref:FAD/FMN-containing dehydrogenase n=1 Tax=Chelatococcus asaccharovorans TaxID=28210 RepID=A0A2V3U9Z0_9HYPH|nr:FAD-binding oxidoreductase [Chelatococcus asaccharovorans]MBS7705511.1 FAD-binding oxidoreductase [Chelatococcus asaccharovorans]PXW60084.1 FAD/FMN-containing dehydrogenase [Chelatococcus asaccharovorans]